VVADTETLRTLPDRELSAGLAEVIKYGLIDDPELFTWLEGNIGDLRARDAATLAHAIERSCRDKALVVAADEREAGRRALLNLGHTFGHAIETGVGYGEWLHGEAVGAGLCMAADLSRRLGWITDTELARIVDLVRAAGLPPAPPRGIATERFLELMAVDKKVLDGRLRLVLLEGIGKALITDGFPLQALRDTLEAA
jgi:3-dehydroquinate synthase